jgi:hypothetical protein
MPYPQFLRLRQQNETIIENTAFLGLKKLDFVTAAAVFLLLLFGIPVTLQIYTPGKTFHTRYLHWQFNRRRRGENPGGAVYRAAT